MKKILISISIIILSIVSIGLTEVALGESPFRELGKKIAVNTENNQSVQTGVVPKKVNGESINPKDISDYQAYLEEVQGQKSDVAKQNAIDKVIEDTILYNEAKKRNLVISIEEAKAFSQSQRNIINNDQTQNSQEVKLMISNLIEGLGITEEQYWNEYAVKGYLKYNSIGKLKAQITKNAKNDAEQDQAWNDYVTGLKKSATINYE